MRPVDYCLEACPTQTCSMCDMEVKKMSDIYNEKAILSKESETVKEILIDCDNLNGELLAELRSVRNAIYGYDQIKDIPTSNLPPDESILDTLKRHRNDIRSSLELILNIKGGLW